MNPPPWKTEDFRLVIGSTKIDYDREKDDANRTKHHYSLESAVHFFTRLLLPSHQPPFLTHDASTADERRHEHMTVDDQGNIVFLVTTMRSEETIRIISLRRANSKEREVFTALSGFQELDHHHHSNEVKS
ncbi:MAG TPA: BrnT family toxin [Rhodocyclaceae bacterium]|nr:BrnT family toxin [Rhodocyclaceae bacterium]